MGISGVSLIFSKFRIKIALNRKKLFCIVIYNANPSWRIFASPYVSLRQVKFRVFIMCIHAPVVFACALVGVFFSQPRVRFLFGALVTP